NKITELPYMASINQNCVLNVRSNKLTFEDLEVNVIFTDFRYEYQDTVLPIETFSSYLQTKLKVLAKGEYNKYQWKKDTSLIDGATDSTYIATEDGIYSCIVTNPMAPNLTLYTADTTIVIDTVTSVSNNNEGHFNIINLPNPFSSNSIIELNLASGTEIRLTVYDVLGIEICVLEKGYLNEGYHEYRFVPALYNLPAGMYFYAISTSKGKTVKKMMYIK
ncbi:MAG: T9SS type A sorting domain-containing protein, partial [Bacteroidota bacterium]